MTIASPDDMQFLLQSKEADKARQMRDLDSRLELRRKKKLEQELAVLHKKELELLDDPTKLREAKLVAMNASVAVQQEVDEARMVAALQEQADVEMKQTSQQHENAVKTIEAQAKAEHDKIQSTAMDNDARNRLLKQYDIDAAKMEGTAALARGKAEDDLQVRLAEKRRKKHEFLAEKAKEEIAIVLPSSEEDNPEDVMARIESLRQESSVAIWQEEDLANVSSDLLQEAQAEIRMLWDELKEKALNMIQGENARFEDDMTLVDASGEESEILLKRNNEELCSMTAQMDAKEAKQIAILKARLIAKKSRKQRSLKVTHVKELEQVKLHGWVEEPRMFNADEEKKRLAIEMKQKVQKLNKTNPE
jgi:hypothetical protein